MLVIVDRNLPTKAPTRENRIRYEKRDLAHRHIDLRAFLAARRLLTQSMHKSHGIISAGPLGADGAVSGIGDLLAALVGFGT